MAIELLQLSNLKLFLIKIFLLTLAFLAPVSGVIFAMIFLVFCDLVTGIVASNCKNEKITSSKMSRTITKLLVYFSTIVITRIINEYLLSGSIAIPLTSLVTSYISLTELKSILENLDKMTKGEIGFLNSILSALSNTRHRTQTPKKIKDRKPRKK
jgi:phage-related holin